MTDLHSIPVKEFVFRKAKRKATCRTCGRERSAASSRETSRRMLGYTPTRLVSLRSGSNAGGAQRCGPRLNW